MRNKPFSRSRQMTTTTEEIHTGYEEICRIERIEKPYFSRKKPDLQWHVHVGPHEKSVNHFNRLRDAKAYVARRAESDKRRQEARDYNAETKARREAGISTTGLRLGRRARVLDQNNENVAHVGGVRMSLTETRDEDDGARLWWVTLHVNAGYNRRRDFVAGLIREGGMGSYPVEWETHDGEVQKVSSECADYCAFRGTEKSPEGVAERLAEFTMQDALVQMVSK